MQRGDLSHLRPGRQLGRKRAWSLRLAAQIKTPATPSPTWPYSPQLHRSLGYFELKVTDADLGGPTGVELDRKNAFTLPGRIV